MLGAMRTPRQQAAQALLPDNDAETPTAAAAG
jgi:hypothetical protein